MKIAHLFETNAKLSIQSEVYKTIQEFENVFTDGINAYMFSIDSTTGRLNYDGNIEFPKESYVDNSGKLPFSFGRVNGDFVLIAGYTDKLKDLSGLPTYVAGDFKIFSNLPKPAEFFRHFPKSVHRLDLTALVIHDCDFGIETCNIFSIDSFTHIHSLKGSPPKVNTYEINCSKYFVETFEGISPDITGLLKIWVEPAHHDDFDFGDLPFKAKRIQMINVNAHTFKKDYPMLAFFKVKGLVSIMSNLVGGNTEVLHVLNKYLIDGDVFECQEELLDNKKLKGFAKAK